MTTSIHDASIAVAATLLIEISAAFAIVYLKVNRRAENLVFACLCTLFAFVLLGARMMQVAPDVASAVLWYRLQLAAAAFAAVMVLDFTCRITRLPFSYGKLGIACLYGVGAFMFAAPWFSSVIAAPRGPVPIYDIDEHGRGPLFAPFVGVLLLLLVSACSIAWSGWFRHLAVSRRAGGSHPFIRRSRRQVVVGTPLPHPAPANGRRGGPGLNTTACQRESAWISGEFRFRTLRFPEVQAANGMQVSKTTQPPSGKETGTAATRPPSAISSAANMGWLAVALTAILIGCIVEYLWALGFDAPTADHINPRAIGVCLFAVVVASMLVQDLLGSLVDRHKLVAENQRLAELALARLNAVRDTQHEIHNGLSSVRHRLHGAMESLPTVGSDDARRRLSLGLKQFESVQSILEVMLDVARLEAGQPLAPGKQSACDVAQVVSGACHRHSVNRFRIENRLKSARYYVFPAFFERVLNNLISNACKFSPPGSPIVVCMEEWDDPNSGEELLYVRITDQGIGIEQKDLEAIFEKPFYRTDAAIRIPGTGAGLNLCRRYADAQNGRLWAESEGLGKGSTFHLVLPREPELPDDTAASTDEGSDKSVLPQL